MQSKKVLIVDNNDLNRKLFESLIGQLYQVESAKNGIEAVGKASEKKFDLILMEIQMPKMDGVTTAKMIWKQSAHQCPIIAIKANSLASDKKSFLDKGFADLITKPIIPQEFLAQIDSNISSEKGGSPESSVISEEDIILDQKVIDQLSKYNSKEGIKSLYVDFLTEFDEIICFIDTAFHEKNQQRLIENLHTIKGNSGSLGANAIFILSSDADVQARAAKWDSLGLTLKKLKNERINFERYLAEETTFKLWITQKKF